MNPVVIPRNPPNERGRDRACRQQQWASDGRLTECPTMPRSYPIRATPDPTLTSDVRAMPTMTETTFHTIKDEHGLQDWPDSTSHRETLGRPGRPNPSQDRHDGRGRHPRRRRRRRLPEYTVEWDYEVVVKVGSEVVWRTPGTAK